MGSKVLKESDQFFFFLLIDGFTTGVGFCPLRRFNRFGEFTR